MKKTYFRLAWVICILGLVGLSCNVLSQVNETSGTAQAYITQAQGVIEQGKDIAGTAIAYATENGSKLIGTAQAFATQNPWILETAQAFVTQQGPALVSTAQALATQHPDLLTTVEAAATQIGQESPNTPPADIPILPSSQIESFYSDRNTVSYFTPLSYPEVLNFYKTEMLNKGWTPVAEGTVESDNLAVLNYTRLNNNARIILSHNSASNRTSVMVTANPK